MNQLDNGKRITLTSKSSILSSNEKISISASTPSISTTIDSSSKLLISTSLNSSSNLSHSLPSSPLPPHTPNSIGVVPLSSTHIKDKIVVSTSTESESNSIQSELVSEPTQVETHTRRPLVSYEEEDSKGSSPEPQSVASDTVKEDVKEETLEEEKAEEEEATTLSEADCASSAAPLDAAVEDQKPSTSSASTSADPSSAEQSQKPKTKRVRISLKLDQLSVLRLERLASENPKLLRKLGLKAYRINNFNGSSKRFQLIRVPNPVPRPSESSLANPSSQQQLRGLRRPSRAPSASSIGVVSFPPPSPTPRFRAPYPHQRNISAFEYSKGNPPVTPAFPMDRTQQLQPQQFQYSYSSQQQQQPQRPPRYSSPAPPSMPPQQQQQQQQQIPQQQPQQQSIRPTQMQEPGPSNNCDSPLLVNLLSNNSQQPPQQPMQQQIRYQTPQQPQQMSHQMMSVQQQQHPGYPPQQLQPNMHMMQQQQYPPYQQHRMPGPGNMGPGGMQQMGGQPPHMMPPQGIPPQQQMQPQQPVPQEAPKKRKRPSKKKKEEDQAKADAAAAQAAQMEQRRLMQQQQQQPQQMQEYYMMQRMPQQVPRHMQQGMPPNYAGYHGYPQGQPSTSMMAPGYPPQHGYPQPQQPIWNHEYQYNMQMMRPQGQPQNPGTPTSGYPPPHQSPGYPPNAAAAAVQQQQQQKVKTPNYPQPSPQYAGGQTPQQAMNRQFMSPQNHPSPGYQQPPQQFGYPQPTQPQQPPPPQQQQAVNRQGQPQQQPNSQQQNTSGGLEDYGTFHDYNGASLEDLAATFGDLGGEDCDLDSITPMNTDPMIPHQQQQQQHQAQHQQMMQQNQQGIMHSQQQQQQMPQYDQQQQQHQFVAPHMPQHQQSAMGPPQGYYQQMPGHNQQQDMQGHFQRPPSAGHPAHMQMYMHHPQAQQQQPQHHQPQQQQQQVQQQQQQVPQPQVQQQPAPPPPPQNDKPPNGKNEDGFTTPFDADIKSPSKINVEQQGKIMTTIDDVMSKIRNNDKAYFDNITTQWNNNPNGDDPPPASATTNKRKAKSTSSRPPSRQPKNSQPSSAAATPTSGPGPFFGGNSTGTEPSTPIKEEPMDFKQERKNSTLSSLLSGSSTPTTIKCEENGHPEIASASSLSSSIVKTESRDTETPQSVTSGITEGENTAASISPTTNPPPQTDAGVLKVEGNGSNNNHGSQQQQLYNGVPSTTATTTSPRENDNIPVSLKSDPSSITSATGDMPPPRKIRKTESSPNAVEDYYPGDSEISTTTATTS